MRGTTASHVWTPIPVSSTTGCRAFSPTSAKAYVEGDSLSTTEKRTAPTASHEGSSRTKAATEGFLMSTILLRL